MQDLRKHRHLVIRDTGSQRRSGSWLGAEQSWTVSHKATSIHAAVMGLGFAWFPEETVRGELERGELKPLPLREGGERWADLYLVFADRDYAGPGALRLAESSAKVPSQPLGVYCLPQDPRRVYTRLESRRAMLQEGPDERADIPAQTPQHGALRSPKKGQAGCGAAG